MIVFLLALLGSAIGAYVGTYLREKGRNLATREDIGEITARVESAKSEYARDLARVTEALKAQTGMRLLAGERRLQAHQEAYAHWSKLRHHAADEKGLDMALEAAAWWDNNALYLEAEPRELFMKAVVAAGYHFELIDTNRGQGQEEAAKVVANMDTIRALGPALVRACELPPLAVDQDSAPADSPFGDR